MSNYWYRDSGPESDLVIASRVRLLRNYDGRMFPGKMSQAERSEVLLRTEEASEKLAGTLGVELNRVPLDTLSPEQKMALHERQIMNHSALLSTDDIGLFSSADEAFSLTVNCTDHLRFLSSGWGKILPELYERVSAAAAVIGDKTPYAFDEKLGYLTSQIENLGTGMRAYTVVHLPLLSAGKGFQKLCQDMSRCGVLLREAWTRDAQGTGGLYVLYNQRTLGMTEREILSFVTGVTDRLAENERRLRVNIPRIQLRDMVYRSYGILEYASLLDLGEACRHLSNLMLGESLGLLRCEGSLTLYELLLGVFPGNLQVFLNSAAGSAELKEKRSAYIRAFLPGIRLTE